MGVEPPPKEKAKPAAKKTEEPANNLPGAEQARGRIKPRRGIRGESLVVISNSENRMNAELLKETKAIVEEMGDELEQELSAPGAEGAEMGAPGEEFPPAEGEMPPIEGDMPPGEGGSPEDEALELLRTIATGIDRMAAEIAPIEAEAEEELGEEPPMEPEGDFEDEEEGEGSAVPPVEDEDEFTETMPVPTGA